MVFLFKAEGKRMKMDRKINAKSDKGKLKTNRKSRTPTAKSTSKTNGMHLPMPYEHAHIGIVESSLDGKYLNVNKEFCRISGYKKQELLKGQGKLFTHEEDLKLYKQLANGEIPFYKLEKQYVHKDGTTMWAELTRSAVRNARGKILYIVSTVLEISERKAADAEAKWQAHLLAELADAVVITDENFVLTGWNKAAEEIYGWQAEEVIGKTAQEVLQTDFITGTREAARGQVRKSGSFSGEVSQVRKDGTRVMIEGKVIAAHNDDGNIKGYISVNREVSERKRAEQTLREHQQRLTATYQHAPIGIVEASPEGKFLNANGEFCRIVGYEKEELLRGGIMDVTHSEDAPIDIKLHQQLVQGRIPFYRLEKRYVRKQGDEVWVELTRSLVCDAEGKPLYTVGAVLDISDRKQVERVLRESVERLRLATEAARMFTWEWDFENRSYALADSFTQVLGFHTDLLSKNEFDTLQKLVPAEDLQAISEVYQQAIQNQSDIHAVLCRVVNPETGQSVWLEISAKIVYDAGRQPVRMFGVAQNVTETKQTQDEIAIISKMPGENPNPVMRLTPDGNILYANSPAKVLLKSWKLQSGQTIPDELRQQVAEAFASGTKRLTEVAQNGQTFSCTLAPIREAGYVNFYGSDITPRKRAEEKLRESEERFRALVSQATAGIAQTDLKNRLVFVNPKFCEMLGYSEAELLGKSIWELTYRDDLEENKHLFERLLTEGTSFEFEKRFLRQDSFGLWTSVSVSPIYGLDGKPKGGVGVVVDMQERKQAEQALRDSVRQQEALYKLSDELHRTVSLEDVFSASLDAIVNSLQCDRASILLFDDRDVMQFVAWRGLSDAYRKATTGHSPWTADTEDPEPISINDVRTGELSDWLRAVIEAEGIGSLAFIPLVSNGKLIGKFMTYFDTPHIFTERELDLSLTIAYQLAFGVERKRAEDALARERELLERLFETIPVMLTIYDPSTNLLRLNAEFERLIGWSSEEAVGISLMEACYPDPEYRERVRRFMESAARDQWMDIQMQTRAGRRLETSWANIRLSNDLQVGIGLDITERKQAENRLALLGEISEILRNVEDSKELLYAAARAVGEHLQVKRCLFNEIDVEHDREVVDYDYYDEVPSVAGVHKLSAYSRVTSAEMQRGKTVVNTDSKIDARTAPDYERTYGPARERAYVAVPLMHENRWVASLWASDDQPRAWSQDEVSLLEVIAERTWTAVEKLRLREQLRAKDAELEAIINQTPFMLTRCTRDLRYRFVSRAYADMIGRTPEEVAGKPIMEIMGEAGFKTIAPYVEKVLQGEPVEYEDQVSFQGVGKPFLHVVYTPDRDQDGNVVGWFASILDISARKQAEEALRIENERFMRFVNSNIVGILIGRSNGEVLLANDYYLDLLGVSRQDFDAGNVDWRKFTPPEWLPADEKALQELHERGVCEPYEKEYMRADGTRVPVYITDAILPGPNGEIAAFVLDIGERKRIERALARERELLERLFETMPVMVSIYDPSTKTARFNSHFEKLTGWKMNEVAFLSLLEACYPDPEYRKQVTQQLAAGPEGEWIDVRMQTRAGHTLETSWSNIRFSDGMNVSIGIDISERKQAEEVLRRNEKMFSTLINVAPFGVYLVDSDFRLRAINKGSEAVFSGIEPLIGRDFAEILRIVWKEPFATEAIERFRQTLRTGESFISPPIIKERANIDEIQSYDWQIHRIPLADGTDGVVCYFYDLSEQKRMEAEVRASEALYRTIARRIPGGGVYIVDKDFRYLVAEGPVTEAFGLSRQTIEGHTVSEVFQGEQRSRMIERLERNFAGETLDYETEHRGRVYWIQQVPLKDSIGQAIILTIDITERKQAEEALRQSEERFARFMQHLPGLAWIKDMQGRYIYANESAEKAFGATKERLYGKTDQEVFPPETAAQFQRNDQQALADAQGIQVIEALKQDDGILHYSLVSKFPIPGPARDSVLIGGTAFDITERMQAEEALRESEERFRAILRQATAGIVRKDPEGHFIYVNEAFCNMLGYTEAELLGKTVWEFMYEEDVAENKRSYKRLIDEGLPFNLERRFLRADGSLIWVDASVSPIIDAEGKPQSTVAVEVDITGRKRAEAALQQLNVQLEERVLNRTAKLRAVNQTLREEIGERKRVEEALRQSEATARESEEKLRTLFDLLPVGISFLDPTGQIIQMNSALTNIVRLSQEQLESGAYRSRTYIRADGTVMPPMEFAGGRARSEHRTIHNVETGILLENGEVVWTSVSAAPVDLADVGVVVATVDITDRKRAERALQESHARLRILSQRLVEVQEEERRALARELHDRVGQTLAALNINLIIIHSQLSPETGKQIGTRLSDSMKLVAETIALVRDVMTDLRPSVLDDYGLDAALESHLAQYTARYQIEAKLDKPDHPILRLGPSLEMTFLRIAQEALMNIAKHAHASQVHLSLRQEAGSITLTIQDNGTGIESWQKANRPGSHGLTIMRERAEAFGGTLQVQSVPGEGTTVHVSIPVPAREQTHTGEE